MVDIFINVILPIFLLIGLGAGLERALTLDLETLNKINFYAFVPALIFVKLQDSDLDSAIIVGIASLCLLHLLLLAVLAWLVFNKRWFRGKTSVPRIGVIFYNAGNYGIPLAQLFFGDEGTAVMAIVLMVQNFLNFTLGIYLLARDGSDERVNLGNQVLALLRVPVLWAIVLAMALPPVGGPIGEATRYLADGLVPVMLLTLGIQLARCCLSSHLLQVGTVCTLRLLISPLLMWAILALWPSQLGNHPAILLAVGGLPVAVNTHLLALQYKVDPEIAAQQVFWSTLLSGLTMTVLLYLVR
ncbi:MAG: AEC family transporter [Opitutales bacterium]